MSLIKFDLFGFWVAQVAASHYERGSEVDGYLERMLLANESKPDLPLPSTDCGGAKRRYCQTSSLPPSALTGVVWRHGSRISELMAAPYPYGGLACHPQGA